MFLKNKFEFIKFSILTLTNFTACIMLIGLERIEIITTLFIGFITNQILLLYGVSLLTQSEVKASVIKLLSIFIGKFIVLAIALICALQNLEKNSGYALIIYIFQLIILVISIKRNTKN